jgi:hypothetical protein
MPVTSNWNSVKQGVIDAMSKHAKEFKKEALVDIKSRLDSKGISTAIVKNGVEKTAMTASEYGTGKVYFDEVFKDIDNQPWVDSI